MGAVPPSPSPSSSRPEGGPARATRSTGGPPTAQGVVRHGELRGRVLLVIASLLFGVMAVLAKSAARTVSGPQVAFLRFAVGAAGVAIYAASHRMRVHNGRALLARGGFGGVAVMCYFLAISHLPVGVATLLNYTAPVFTALFAALLLRERPTLGTLGALGMTLAGMVLVTQGSAPAGSSGFGIWHMLGMASALCSGVAVAAIRWARITDGYWEIFGAFCLIGMAVCAPFALRWWVWPSPREWALLVGVGVVSLVAQLAYTYALRFASATIAGVISQLTPVSAMVLGVLLFEDPYGWKSLLGAATTLAGVWWAARIEFRQR